MASAATADGAIVESALAPSAPSEVELQKARDRVRYYEKALEFAINIHEQTLADRDVAQKEFESAKRQLDELTATRGTV